MISQEKVEWAVKDCLRRNDLADKDALIVVGVSGGPDSIALCHSLISLQRSLHYKIHVAHLNHNFRGQEAYDDAEFVEEILSLEGADLNDLGSDCGLAREVIREELIKGGVAGEFIRSF